MLLINFRVPESSSRSWYKLSFLDELPSSNSFVSSNSTSGKSLSNSALLSISVLSSVAWIGSSMVCSL